MVRLLRSKKCKTFSSGYINSLTLNMDYYCLDKTTLEYLDGVGTYILNERQDNKYYIRFPGSTVGIVLVDCNNIIKNIYINDNVNFVRRLYKNKVVNCFDKYIGMKLVFD